MDQPALCPKCGTILLPNTNFCPTCGFQITAAPTTISIGRQIWIYFVSIFLPPFGLIWTFTYLFHGTPQQKRVAYIAAGLTIISIIVTVWITVGFFQGVSSQLNSLQNVGL